ncbi:MAG: ribonuclease R [Corallococcus sp.]|nr:ribonuclease R [Corallococcus sp.]
MNINEKILQTARNIQSDYFTAKQLRVILGAQSTVERNIIAKALQELVDGNELVFDARNRRYRVIREGDFSKAVFEGNARGFGFLLREDGGDLFVSASKTNGAFHKDVVLYKRTEGTEDEAEIVKVLERGMREIVGVYDKSNNARFVVPDDKRFFKDVYVQPKKDMNAKNGQKVVARINVYPDSVSAKPEGEIVQILGFPDEKNVDMLSVAAAYGLSEVFGDKCAARAAKMPTALRDKDYEGRRDLRKETVFTIDGEDAKDLDDAVSVKRNSNGTFTLGVHIADVSHYVKPDDDIDKEAFLRGTSVYFPERVFPMLPRELSNGICSLYENVDRLTLTCEMVIDNCGKVVDSDIYLSVINSRHRLTYDEVQAIFDGVASVSKRYADIYNDLFAMKELAEILQNKRNKRGNIEFVTKEVCFVHDDSGNVIDVVPRDSGFSHQLIEEFMIAANETVAEYAQICAYPFVYRVHDKPSDDKLSVLFALMKGLGINVKRSKEIHNSILQDALKQAEQTPYFRLVNDVMLRSMQKAKYSDVNTGHFGLASSCYCHFTSPIRRYPDLVVHRILKTAVSGKMTEKALRAYGDMAYAAAKQASVRERVADEAERKADDVKKCAYAETIIGQSFSARISGVTERGIFAEMENTVEGFIPADRLGGVFRFNPDLFCLYNDGARYSLGDEISITVIGVNKQACKIDFDLAAKSDETASGRASRK